MREIQLQLKVGGWKLRVVFRKRVVHESRRKLLGSR